MKDCIDVEAVTKRLKRIEGQVRGIMKMIENNKPCEDIIIQIGSIKAALHKTGQIILEWHLHNCMKEAIENNNSERAMNDLLTALNQFSKIV